MRAMILAAGLGTRLKPFTDHHPKALAVVGGKTLLQRNIEYLAGFGITDVIVNVHHFAEQVSAFIKKNNDFGSHIVLSDESDEVLETGGGLKKASWFFQGDTDPFIVINVDILTNLPLADLITTHHESKAIATLAVSERKTSRYFLFDDNGFLCGWRNQKTGEEKICRQAPKMISKAFSGIQVLSPDIFPLIHEEGKFSLVDMYLKLCTQHIIQSYDHTGYEVIDAGTSESLKWAEEIFGYG